MNKLIYAAMFVVIFINFSFAQTGKVTDVEAQSAQVTEFEVNGMKILVKRRAAAPTVAVGLFFRSGAGSVTSKNAGIENLTLSAATDGGKKYPREVVRRELSRTGSEIGASASNDFSVISMATTRENFDKNWDIFTDVSLNPAFAPEDIERERRQILTGLREEEVSPNGALESLENRVVYANHPYANVGGTIQSIGALTAADLKAYHQNLMQTSNLLLVIVGDLDANELKSRITAAFGNLPRGSYQSKPYPALDFSKSTLDVVSRSYPTNYIEGVFNAPSLSNPDYPAMRVATAILQQRVFEEVRVRRQLSYAPDASLDNFAVNTANISVTAVDANQSVTVMLGEINNLKTKLVSDDAIEGISGGFLTNYYMRQETNGAQVLELARYELIGGGWRNAFTFLNKVREVKAENIQAVSKKYMKNIRFVVVGNPAAINKDVFSFNEKN